MRPISVLTLLACVACGAEKPATESKLKKLGKLPAEIVESSGLARGPAAGVYFTHGDSGTAAELYAVHENGKLVNRWKLAGAKQRDWEAMTVDDRGRVYICDSGNNFHNRRDLTIYCLDFKRPDALGSIVFDYPDQREFPPRKMDQSFDVEACVWHDKHLYLFSKDRIRSRASRIYRLKTEGPARQTAELLGELAIDGQVTDAALSPKADRLVLLCQQKLFVAKIEKGDLIGARFEKHELKDAGQTEAATFIDDSHLLISNEQGDLFRFELP